MKRIIYTRPDGGVSVVRPVISADDPEGFSNGDAVVRALAKDVPSGATDVRVVEENEVPTDRTFRNAWKNDLSIDMPKARGIHRDRIRAARATALAALDGEWMKASGQKKDAEAAVIEAKRQALRDAPADPRIDAANTPDELKAVWPL